MKQLPCLSFCVCSLLLMHPERLLRAADYHVRQGGSDEADGLTDATAWASIERVNAARLRPGDRVLLRRGDRWQAGTLRPGSDGEPGMPVVFGAYGTGAKPLIDGGHQGVACIRIEGRKHLVVEQLAAQDTEDRIAPTDQPGKADAVAVVGSSCITLRALEVRNSGNGAIVATRSDHVWVDGCTVTNAGNNGIYFKGSAEPRIRDSVIENCVVTKTRANDGIVIHEEFGTNAPAGARFILRNNVSTENDEEGYDITTGTDILLEGNRSARNRLGSCNVGHSASRVTLRYHRTENEPAADTAQTIKITVPEVTIEHSQLVGSANWIKPIVAILAADGVRPEQVRILNTTLVWNHAANGTIFSVAAGAGLEALEVVNCLFTSRTQGRGMLVFADAAPGPGSAGYWIDHNLYHFPRPALWKIAGTDHDFETYRTRTGQDAHGREADPRLRDPGAGDYRLTAESPARDAGRMLGWGRDLAGTPVPQGRAPDIGAWEYVAEAGGGVGAGTGTMIEEGPGDLAAVVGGEAVFEVRLAAGAGRGQWLKDGRPIAGAERPVLSLSPVRMEDRGRYAYRVERTGGGVETSGEAELRIAGAAQRGGLANLSIRSGAGAGDDTLIVGFVVGGRGSFGTKPLLVRVAGPSLAQYGVPGTAEDPALALYGAGEGRVAETGEGKTAEAGEAAGRAESTAGTAAAQANDQWGGVMEVAEAARRLGAFPFISEISRDAALLCRQVRSGAYTVHATNRGRAGATVLAEVYDATGPGGLSEASPRLMNLSARARVSGGAGGAGGDGVLIAGFVVTGHRPVRVLVRAAGPALATHGVADVLDDPVLELYRAGMAEPLAANDRWDEAGTVRETEAAGEAVGAFPFGRGAQDAALCVELTRGSYSAHVRGKGGAAGVALVEVYEVP